MYKNKITKFVQSFAVIPMFAITTPILGITAIPSPTAILSYGVPTVNSEVITTPEEKIRLERAKKVDALLAKYNSPLEGLGMKFVLEAEKHEIDYRLLVAISGRESTFGKYACKKATNSFLGYGSCKINFKSPDDAIERVSASLGGNDDNTDHYYADKTTAQILRKYNSVIPNYPNEVIRIMKMIDSTEEIV